MKQTIPGIPVITIDGPSGSGKGTISLLLAKKLNWHFLDSGAIYRVLAFAAQENNVDENDISGLVAVAGKMDITFEINALASEPNVILEAQNITRQIRTEGCGKVASKIAVHQAVRVALLERQRQFRQTPGLVADGRDMGTVVFPDAPLKIFLSASLQERAKRRYNQLIESGKSVIINSVLEELTERDRRDSERAVAPLKPADDAVLIDTTFLPIDRVLENVMQHVKAKNI